MYKLLFVLLHVCMFQGPMWKQVRGLGLAYHYKSVIWWAACGV